MCNADSDIPAGGFSVFAGVGERTREGNDLYKEMIEGVSPSTSDHFAVMIHPFCDRPPTQNESTIGVGDVSGEG